jgi:hypothetical protein
MHRVDSSHLERGRNQLVNLPSCLYVTFDLLFFGRISMLVHRPWEPSGQVVRRLDRSALHLWVMKTGEDHSCASQNR